MKKRLIILFMLCVVATAGCTVFGQPFDDPVGELSLVGDVFALCKSGRAFYFGHVRNTGPLEVRDATAIVDVFSNSGALLGQFSGAVTESIEEINIILVDENGDPVLGEDGQEVILETIVIEIDTFEVDQSGSFQIETTVGCGTAASEEISFDFTIGVFGEEEL